MVPRVRMQNPWFSEVRSLRLVKLRRMHFTTSTGRLVTSIGPVVLGAEGRRKGR